VRPNSTHEVQDSGREEIVRLHCGLTKIPGRMAPADAKDERGNPFELKSVTKSGVTTARDVGRHTIRGWRRKYWIIAHGRNLDEGFEMDALYVGHPDDLAPCFDRLEKRIEDDWEACETVLKAARRSRVKEAVIDRVKNFCERGITINNPKIPFRLVEERCTQLDHRSPNMAQEQLARFVTSRPIASAK